jgi:hypothetical protein
MSHTEASCLLVLLRPLLLPTTHGAKTPCTTRYLLLDGRSNTELAGVKVLLLNLPAAVPMPLHSARCSWHRHVTVVLLCQTSVRMTAHTLRSPACLLLLLLLLPHTARCHNSMRPQVPAAGRPSDTELAGIKVLLSPMPAAVLVLLHV